MCMLVTVQDDGVERQVFILCKSTKITTSCWTVINKRTLVQRPRSHKMVGGAQKLKSNPMLAGWATYKLENNNAKELLPLLWRLWIPCQASQPGDLTKGLTLKASAIWLQDFHRTGGNRDSSLGGHKKILHAPRPRGKEQWPHRRLNQSHLLVLEGLLWRCGSARAYLGMGHWPQQSLKVPFGVSPLEGSH